MVNVKEMDFVEQKELRNEYLDKVQVLEKVKALLLLPSTELMTTKMVAEYFEVGYEGISTLIKRNKEELNENGMKLSKYSDISNQFKMNGLEYSPKSYGVSPKGTYIFTKRAVLNVAMLLRDSEIAKRIRTALLDQQEEISNEQRTKGITDEQNLLLSIIQSPSEVERAVALSEYNNYKNRHIAELNVRIDEMKPKEKAYDTFIKAENSQKFNEVGKVLGIGQNKLTSFLREKKVIMKSNGRNIPYQSFIDRGLFVVKEGTKENNGVVINYATTYVTPKGIEAIGKLLKKNDLI